MSTQCALDRDSLHGALLLIFGLKDTPLLKIPFFGKEGLQSRRLACMCSYQDRNSFFMIYPAL